jgi:hypothetical protein
MALIEMETIEEAIAALIVIKFKEISLIFFFLI